MHAIACGGNARDNAVNSVIMRRTKRPSQGPTEEFFLSLFDLFILSICDTTSELVLSIKPFRVKMSYSEPPKDGREAAERLRATVKSGKPIIGSGAGIGL